jgi:hypothetical protein
MDSEVLSQIVDSQETSTSDGQRLLLIETFTVTDSRVTVALKNAEIQHSYPLIANRSDLTIVTKSRWNVFFADHQCPGTEGIRSDIIFSTNPLSSLE